ncbi:DNA-3-methyladenine glycosylase 2 family protein [Exilibacterium tricleocarpae]|uniref:DNA-3-methyladenine glycosylase II n=1 Tax=Exilibacterium tricleocarpae TaxID=2591008 RepID=A0A545ST76_9GAMM|nr:DNA-3-methyladenine glycosylase 2 [Exilibacterium tricleocarpae]TQV68173.1 DNA-3-methyladenine glycosylase 2 family protein [Exilibacterium tricleocarpae]
MSAAPEPPIHDADQIAQYERARLSRDPRFDGRFFTGVLSTGIYCRPICPAPAPKARNVVYFHSAAAAAAAGLRPCLRCRPEVAPDSAAWSGTEACVRRALKLIRAGALNDNSTEALAQRLGITDRHLRRLFARHLGAAPKVVATTQRLAFARQLLRETRLPIGELALAAGFKSVRQFNTGFRRAFEMTPGDYRRAQAGPRAQAGLRLLLHYRPPYAWRQLLDFFTTRAIPGVESVDDDSYRRVIRVGTSLGTIAVSQVPGKHCLQLAIEGIDSALLTQVVNRVRLLFDLDASPAAVAEVLAQDPLLAETVAAVPGLRLPGAWEPFELVVRAVLGQQVSVKAARTFAARIVERCGQPLAADAASDVGLTHAFPTPSQLAQADLNGLGITGRRIRTLQQIGAAMAAGDLQLERGMDLATCLAQLQALPGIGPWTAHYIAMRGLSEPDAFPEGDLGLLKALQRVEPQAGVRELSQRAEAWRPWRAYAVMYLWQTLA